MVGACDFVKVPIWWLGAVEIPGLALVNAVIQLTHVRKHIDIEGRYNGNLFHSSLDTVPTILVIQNAL